MRRPIPKEKFIHFRAAYLIDASGRGNLTGNQEGLRITHPRHKKLAIFGHFTGVVRDAGEANSDIIIVRCLTNGFGSSRFPPRRPAWGW